MTPPPLAFRWDGEAMVPLHPRIADRYFVVGETYQLVEHQERSSASHRHFFALVNEAFENLRGLDIVRFPTPEHLRKWALIKAGYFDAQVYVCEFKTEARRLAAALRPQDEYAVVTVSDKVVTVYRAQSQSLRAMGKQRFQESKDKVLAILADMIGVAPAALGRAQAA